MRKAQLFMAAVQGDVQIIYAEGDNAQAGRLARRLLSCRLYALVSLTAIPAVETGVVYTQQTARTRCP